MNQVTILLTAGGGAALPTLIDKLRAGGYRVIAVDADVNAAGLYLADRGYRIPFANDPNFLPAMRRICDKEDVRVLVPLVDEELLPMSQLANELGIALIGPQAPFIELSLDKYDLMRRMAAAGLPIPETRLLTQGVSGLSFPLILKPRVGRGSRGIKVVRNYQELDAYLSSAQPGQDATLIQSYIEGAEFTVSVVVWRDGRVRAVVPKEVIDKRGITKIAVTRYNEAIDTLCRNIQERLCANGPFNVQLRIDPSSGTPLTFEINPRFSTTITLTQAAGVDELGALVEVALGREPDPSAWQWREGVTLIRRTLDSFIDVKNYDERRAAAEHIP